MTAGTDQNRLAFTQHGSGDPVVIIHGFTGSGEAMAPLVDRLEGWKRIAVDLPGHGRSPAPAALDAYRVDDMAESVERAAERVTGQPVHVVGYSMGGRVALTWAVAHPQRCRSLTLISATAGMSDECERTRRRQADAALADRIGRHGLDRFVGDWMAAPMWDTLRAHLSEAEWDASMRQRRSCDPVGLTNSLRAGGTGTMTPLWDRLPTLDMPTLIVCGELDAKFVEIGRRMSELLPKSKLAVIPAVGHAVHLEAPDLCADTAAGFIHRAPLRGERL